MFKGFTICSHAVATAEHNGELKTFLESVASTCEPNLSVIANAGMPSGSGRKGGVPKQHKRKRNAIETRSVRQCLEESVQCSASQTQACHPKLTKQPTMVNQAVVSSEQTHILSRISSSQPAMRRPTQVCMSLPHAQSASSSSQSTSALPHLGTCNNAVISGGRVGGRAVSVDHIPPNASATNPFILKLKTSLVRICQSCRLDYNGPNNTMNLVVARAERRLVSNLATGAQFFGKESNSHYHLRLSCLRGADPNFTGANIVIPTEVKNVLSTNQRMCLMTYINVPPTQLLL